MAKRRKKQFSLFSIISILIIILISLIISRYTFNKGNSTTSFQETSTIPQDVIKSLTAPSENEANDNTKYKILNNNNPYFSKEDLSTTSFENYSPLDSLGRVGQANGLIGVDLMPTERRGRLAK